MSPYQRVAQMLLSIKDLINATLISPEDELHRLRLEKHLKADADYMLLITGAGDLTNTPTIALGPATTIGGKKISKIPKITEADLLPSDDKVLNLKQKVEIALPEFIELSSDSILATMEDIVIRGIAKKAGLEVTKDKPAVLTVEFIDNIKAALSEPEESKASDVTPSLEEEQNGKAGLEGDEQKVNLEEALVKQQEAQQVYDQAKAEYDKATVDKKPKAELKQLEAAMKKAEDVVMEISIKVEELQNANKD